MPVKPKAEAAAKPAKKSKSLETLRGFRDILPDEQAAWEKIEDIARNLTHAYGFGRIRLPALEATSLFERGVGKETDIVEKEMFTFVDQGGIKMTLRPEGTASAARAYIEHGMLNQPQPVKLWYLEPFFRH
jgi:histidyl-tRNA synthetase